MFETRLRPRRHDRSSIRLAGTAAFLILATSPAIAYPDAGPPLSGTISVEVDAADPAMGAAFVDAAGQALAARGFTVLEGAGHARYVAALSVTRDDVGTTTAKITNDRSSLATGGGVGVGASFSVPLPSSKTKQVPLRQTRLEIRIHERDETGVLWHGAAVAVRAAETPRGRDAPVASDLIETALRIYPEQSETVASAP